MKDLFEIQVGHEKLHPNFKRYLPDIESYAREIYNQWFNRFHDKDGKFIKEFQTTFDPAFWELYLHEVFYHLNFNFDYSHAAPDFILEKDSVSLLIEAAIASNADGAIPQYEQINHIKQPLDLKSLVANSCLRIANTITKKHKKYIESYSKLNHVNSQPYIIAIAPFNEPFAQSQNLEPILKVLYGCEIRKTPKGYERKELPHIEKPNGAKVPMGLFRSSEFKEVSAILFSTTGTASKIRAMSNDPREAIVTSLRFNAEQGSPDLAQTSLKDYKENITDGIHIFINPHANTPLNTLPFHQKEQYIGLWDWDPDKSEAPQCHIKEGTLISRNIVIINIKDN